MTTWVCATCGPVPAGEIRHLDHNSPHGHERHECGSSAGLDWTTDCPPIRERNTDVTDSLNCAIGDCDMCAWLRCTHDCHGDDFDIAICGGCGAYGRLGEFHVRNGEECGEFV